MNKPFVPFDQFERECMPEGKPLHETMQENCNARHVPPPEPCPNPCVPYWQPTGNRRCLDIGVVEIEEADGCGHTRFTRVADPVVWTDTEETRCDEPRNRIQQQQINQCGGTRWVTTSELCCTPNWVPDMGNIDCTQSMERVLEEDGCGNTRLRSTGFPVNWVSTGEVRCEPGDIYQVEQTNQCGDTRWFTVPGGCPCIPDWQPSGPERCTGEFIEVQEVDGCGHTRWNPTSTEVVWTNTGETRCNGGFVQNQQISQCGTTRWFTTGTPCVTSPPPNEDSAPDWDSCLSRTGVNVWRQLTISLDAAAGVITWRDQRDAGLGSNGEGSFPWVTGAYNRADYEARISYVAVESTGALRTQSGTALDTWFNLGDVSLIQGVWRASNPSNGTTDWDVTSIRIDIRRVGGPIEGGATFGPNFFRINGDCP